MLMAVETGVIPLQDGLWCECHEELTRTETAVRSEYPQTATR